MSGAIHRISSLVRKKTGRTPYQTWEEEDDTDLEVGCEFTASSPVSITTSTIATPDEVNGQERVPQLGNNAGLEAEQELVECFYLGSYEMAGLEIQGRGCINLPAAAIWQKSQHQDKNPRRMGSWSGRQPHGSSATAFACVKPHYVKLATGSDSLQVQDQGNNKVIMEFSYKKISFVGTHPNHTRLFAFIAESSITPAPFCYAFKCEDRDSAKKTACMLSDVFHKKIQQLVLQSMQKVTNDPSDSPLVP